MSEHELRNKLMAIVVDSGLPYRECISALSYVTVVLRDKGNNLLNDTSIQEVAKTERFIH